jgi:hypothetical protein
MKIVKSDFDEKSSIKVCRKKSAENFSSKVWLQKVNQICLDIFSQPATITGPGLWFFHQGSLENFPSKSAENFLIKLRLKK